MNYKGNNDDCNEDKCHVRIGNLQGSVMLTVTCVIHEMQVLMWATMMIVTVI